MNVRLATYVVGTDDNGTEAIGLRLRARLIAEPAHSQNSQEGAQPNER